MQNLGKQQKLAFLLGCVTIFVLVLFPLYFRSLKHLSITVPTATSGVFTSFPDAYIPVKPGWNQIYFNSLPSDDSVGLEIGVITLNPGVYWIRGVSIASWWDVTLPDRSFSDLNDTFYPSGNCELIVQDGEQVVPLSLGTHAQAVWNVPSLFDAIRVVAEPTTVSCDTHECNVDCSLSNRCHCSTWFLLVDWRMCGWACLIPLECLRAWRSLL
jgi:hypothetical protein